MKIANESQTAMPCNSMRVLTPERAVSDGLIVGLSLQSLYRLCRAGLIPCQKVGRRYLLSEAAILHWASQGSAGAKG